MSDISSMLGDSVTRLFRDNLDREFLQEQEKMGWAAQLWELTEELGLSSVVVKEDNGGVGGDWADAYEIVKGCGRFAVPLPLPETIVARWLLDQTNLVAPKGPLTLMPSIDGSDAKRIPWGRNAVAGCTTQAADSGNIVRLVDFTDVVFTHEVNLAKEPRDNCSMIGNFCDGAVNMPATASFYLGAMIRSAQISGVAMALLEQATIYSGERSQFGRNLNKFQTVQHNLARLATAAASLDSISRFAFATMDNVGFKDDAKTDVRFAIAAAKSRASECVDLICALSHQIHGAIGFTYEHTLHFYSRRAWSWRSEFGGSSYWANTLGDIALGLGSEKLWGAITALGINETKTAN
jgi:acyl-CoA dehydrogenase